MGRGKIHLQLYHDRMIKGGTIRSDFSMIQDTYLVNTLNVSEELHELL